MTRRNGLKKMPLRRIKDMVKCGAATEVKTCDEILRHKDITQIAYSMGTNGCNGCLFKDDEGKMYATLGASTITDYFSY